MSTSSAFLATFAIAALAGCSASGFDPSSGESRAAIVGGEVSGVSQDAVVKLVHYGQGAVPLTSCTGTLVAPNLVLTARHCVAQTDAEAACNGDVPAGPDQAKVYKDFDAGSLFVFPGGAPSEFRANLIDTYPRGVKLFTPTSKVVCNSDIALVLLDRAVGIAQFAPIRLDRRPSVGEQMTAVGWGVTDDQGSEPSSRMQRRGVTIDALGPLASTGLGSKEFQAAASACSGDSGGPALAEASGAVIGVYSGVRARRGGSLFGKCQSGAINRYTELPAFQELILAAFAASGHRPWLEGTSPPIVIVDRDRFDRVRDGVIGHWGR